MYDEPYLETCCRSALHRVILAGAAGRPDTEKDAPCLRRLSRMGMVAERVTADGARWEVTPAGEARHQSCVLKPS